jgi:hypothetical protein
MIAGTLERLVEFNDTRFPARFSMKAEQHAATPTPWIAMLAMF